MPAAVTEAARNPGVEVIPTYVHRETRTWVDHPSRYGFFTLDRAWGQELIVTYYALRAGHEDSIAISQSLSDWKGSPYPPGIKNQLMLS